VTTHPARWRPKEQVLSTYLISPAITAFAQTEMGRILASAAAIFVAALLLKVIQRRARNQSRACLEDQHGKNSFVLLKNVVLLCTMLVIAAIWASKIAGAALSLAAVGGAMLIISKEFVANLLGSAYLTATRSYRVGDFIEIDGLSGRVIDTDLLATTLLEMGDGSQLTSRAATIPHSLLLTKPLHNLTATGEFAINMLKIVVDPSDDLIAHEKALLKAANDVCGPWLVNANLHLMRFESRELMDLPSAHPRVILQLHSAKEATLSLRYTCVPNQKVNVEQTILRNYLKGRPSSCWQEPT
jgi:small-conductance mechanosensitive channel